MDKVADKQVSFADVADVGKKLRVVAGSEGHIRLKIIRDGHVEKLETNWFNFYIGSRLTVIEAFFGEDTGGRVPAISLLANEELKVGSYEIKNPFDDPWTVAGIFGMGRPGAVAGDGWGKGKLIVSEISSGQSEQYIKGSFEFIYIDRDEVVVKVVAEEIWAKYSE